MRLEAVIKKGFYPLDTIAIPYIASKIIAGPETTILDPCAGEGEAIDQIAQLAGIPRERVTALELDGIRSVKLAERLSGARVFGTIDFLSCISWGRASVVYCNPPFDDELGGGGRIEPQFVDRAVNRCVPGGLCIFVLPEHVAYAYDFGRLLTSRLYDIQLADLPVNDGSKRL